MSGFIAEFKFAPKAVAFVLAGRFWGLTKSFVNGGGAAGRDSHFPHPSPAKYFAAFTVGFTLFGVRERQSLRVHIIFTAKSHSSRRSSHFRSRFFGGRLEDFAASSLVTVSLLHNSRFAPCLDL
jgi:hypothetical protein